MVDPIRVFVGGTDEHRLAAKVLEFSILSHASRDVEFRMIADCGIPNPDSGGLTPTSFSLQRFMIPEICGFTGRGIYLDSDMIVRTDIATLFDRPFHAPAKVQACPGWQSAVMLIDNSIGWKVADIADKIKRRDWKYTHASSLKVFPQEIISRELPKQWNCMDTPCDPCYLLHYTGMRTQPWLYAKHPYGGLWEQALTDALATGFIHETEVLDAIQCGYIRPSLALLIGQEPPYDDTQFIFPDDLRKMQGVA